MFLSALIVFSCLFCVVMNTSTTISATAGAFVATRLLELGYKFCVVEYFVIIICIWFVFSFSEFRSLWFEGVQQRFDCS